MSVAFLVDIPEECSDECDIHNSFCSVIQDAEQEALLELQERNTGHGSQRNDNHCSATLRILADMPSRTIGRCKGAMLSEYYNRTVRRRQSKKRPSLYTMDRSARPSIRQMDEVADGEEEHQRLLVMELQKTSGTQRIRLLKSFPLNLQVKRELRTMTLDINSLWKNANPCCSSITDCIGMATHKCWLSFLSLLCTLRPWHLALKQIGGRFGSSVLSYFLFLKTLLGFNIFMSLLCLLFIVTPQAVHPHNTSNPRSFTSLEILTGAGYFTDTVMYNGYYSNITLNEGCSPGHNASTCPDAKPAWLPYHIPLAYLFTIGLVFLSTCIILVYKMSCSFGDSFRVGFFSGALALKVFSSWDFKVNRIRCVQRQKENINMQLKELLSELRTDRRPDLRKKMQTVCIHVFSWTLCLASWLGSAVAVYVLSEHLYKDNRARMNSETDLEVEAKLLLLPSAVSLCNLLLPYLYHALGLWELLDSPILEVYIAICRNLMLKIVILGVLCYHWLKRKANHSEYKCWETLLGQEFYRFVIMDLIFNLLDTLFGEQLLRLIQQKRHKNKKYRTEFDIARNVLELIYGQTLAWLGVLFCPLLPVIQTLKLLLLFYVKKASLMRNCRSPSKPWRASHMSTVFLTLLCFPSFLGASVFLSYTVWSVTPSKSCGPFRSLNTMYEAGKLYVRQLEVTNPRLSWISWIHHYLWENTLFIYVASSVLLVIIYFHIQIVNGQRKVINLLKEQIANEGEDKCFLIDRLHSVYNKRSRIQRGQRSVQARIAMGKE
ncbi:transmembrane channel-like protein 6 [Pyxicephalus adspersus]